MTKALENDVDITHRFATTQASHEETKYHLIYCDVNIII